MFGLFKKGTLDAKDRLDHIIRQLNTQFDKTSKNTVIDLQTLKNGFDFTTQKDKIPEYLSQILSQKIGFGIISLNIGIRKQTDFRELVYDTFGQWEKCIDTNSINLSIYISQEMQREICNRFIDKHSTLRGVYTHRVSTFDLLKSVRNYFDNTFDEEAYWYAETNNFEVSDKFLRLTKNQYLNTFSYFDKYFSNYKHS